MLYGKSSKGDSMNEDEYKRRQNLCKESMKKILDNVGTGIPYEQNMGMLVYGAILSGFIALGVCFILLCESFGFHEKGWG